MFAHLNVVAAGVFVFFFALVTVLGFAAARWKAADLVSTNGALGGRRFGPGSPGSCSAAISTPPTPLSRCPRSLRHRRLRLLRRSLHDHHLSVPLLTLPRLWAVSHKHRYMTAGRFSSAVMAIAPLSWPSR